MKITTATTLVTMIRIAILVGFATSLIIKSTGLYMVTAPGLALLFPAAGSIMKDIFLGK